MQQVIYIDVLVAVNIIITYLLLLASSRLLRRQISGGKLVFASFLGGMYSLIILAPDLGFFLSSFIKLLLSLSIVSVAYRPNCIRALLRQTAVFFGVNFAFAGIMLCVNLLFSPSGMTYNNGAVYINFSFLSLVLSAAACYITVVLINRLARRNLPVQTEYSVSVTLFGKTVEGKGFLDTGNGLRDLITDVPVIICTGNQMKELTNGADLSPEKIAGEEENLSAEEKKLLGRLRLVPASTVGGTTLLTAVRPDSVTISDGKGSDTVRRVLVAQGKKMSEDDYDFILCPELIDKAGGKENVVKDKAVQETV